MDRIAFIEKEITPLRTELTAHKIYSLLSEIDDIRLFMEKHVYAVWDFMSLLKSLQNHLTCVTLPWKPAKNAKTTRFINEIVMGEESDVNELGHPKSHFEMYLDAMQEVGADTAGVLEFVNRTTGLPGIERIINEADLSPGVKQFLLFTFQTIQTNEPHKVAAAFTFGREDLIPDMFIEIINQSNQGDTNRFPKLTYYLERHIELDGDEHGPLSLEMIRELCGDNNQKWQEALSVAKAALMSRIKLWDEIAGDIEAKIERAGGDDRVGLAQTLATA